MQCIDVNMRVKRALHGDLTSISALYFLVFFIKKLHQVFYA